MPPRRVLPSRHARTGIISYSDTIGAGTLQVPSGGGEGGGGTGEIGTSEYNTNHLSDEENGDDIDEVSTEMYEEGAVIYAILMSRPQLQYHNSHLVFSHNMCIFSCTPNNLCTRLQTQDLTAILPNGRALRVKLKLSDISPQLSPSRDDTTAVETGVWQCHLCGKSNIDGKKRCGHCQAWKGGMRENIRTKKQKLLSPFPQDKEPNIDIIKHDLVAATPSSARGQIVEDMSMEVEGGEKDDPDAEGGPAGSRPKRKRTNVYSSLSEAVIKATSQARAEAFMAAPPVPQHQTKVKPKNLREYVHPGAVAAEKAIAKGRLPEELVGNDGNLFYCRVCLGVVS